MKLHVGCGKNKIAGWVNADISGNADVVFDAGKSFPFESDSIGRIFSEHMLERLTQEQGLVFLSECFRVLKRGGVLRLSTPDLYHIVMRYNKKDLKNITWTPKPTTRCEYVNRAFRLWGHRFLYDAEQLCKSLTIAGFLHFRPVAYQQSEFSELRNLESREYKNELIFEVYR